MMLPDRDSPVSGAYFVVSFGTASWSFLTMVSTFTDVSLTMTVMSRVSLGVITFVPRGPMRSACP